MTKTVYDPIVLAMARRALGPTLVQDLRALRETKVYHAVPMAIVDYAGTVDGDGYIDEAAPFERRYDWRDMRHVAIYNLKVVDLNEAAWDANGK